MKRAMQIAALVGATLLAGCAQGSGKTATRSSAAPGYAAEQLTEYVQHDGAAKLFTPKSLTDALPSVRYYDGTNYIHESTLVVTGSFGAFNKPEARLGTDEGEPADSGSDNPPWKIVVSSLTVSSKIAASAEGSSVTVGRVLPVTFYLPPTADADKFGESLRAMGTVITFLTGGFRGSNEWTVAENALLGTVSATGRIAMSVDISGEAPDIEANGIDVDASSVADLVKSAAAPQIIKVGPAAEVSSPPSPAPTTTSR